jgi:hypothetical protein
LKHSAAAAVLAVALAVFNDNTGSSYIVMLTSAALRAILSALKVCRDSAQVNPEVLRHYGTVAVPFRWLLSEVCSCDR